MKRGQLFQNEYVFSVTTRIVNIVFAIVQSILVARFLGPALKGHSTYITSIISIGSIVITFGMHQAYPYFRRKYGKEVIFKDYMTAVYSVFAAYFIISSIIGLSLECNLDLKMAIILMPIFGFSRVVDYVYLIENPNKRNSYYVLITFLSLIIIVILFFSTKSTYFWMIVLLSFTNFSYAIIYTIKLHCLPHFTNKIVSIIIEIAKFGFFPMLALLMTTLNYKIDVLMIKQYSFISFEMIGIYSVGIGLADKVALIPDTLKGILVSKLAKGASEKEVAKVCRLCFISCLFICTIILLIGEWAIRVFYGEAYAGSYTVVIITAGGAVFIGFFKLIAQYNIINKKQIFNVQLLLIAIIVNVIGNLIFVPLWGINGAAFSTCLGHLICGIVFVIWFSKHAKIPFLSMIFIQKQDMVSIKKYLYK